MIAKVTTARCAAKWSGSAVLLFAIIAFALPLAAQSPEFDSATGYRIARYRTPVPETAPGAQRIFVEQLEKLVAEKDAVLIDVGPAEGAVLDRVSGVWRGVKPHQNIPGSTWLPDVGKGDAAPTIVAYFEQNLERLTGHDKSRAVIIYCQADCWMSWNAVKRATALGYSNLYWFPEGTDGWRDWDKPFAPAAPIPLRAAK